jgi:hypothetical protein
MKGRLPLTMDSVTHSRCHEGSPVFMQKKTKKKVPAYEEVLAEWKGYIDEAAKCPNMVCKSDCLYGDRFSFSAEICIRR